MALLSQILGGAGTQVAQGQLATTSDPTSTANTTLQGAATAANAASTPATPLGAQNMGASPDAAKMAGTPAAQTGAATYESATPAAASQAPQAGGTSSLSNATASGALNTTAQSAQQATDQQHQNQLVQAFGTVGLKVNDLVTGAIADATAASTSTGQPAAYTFDPTNPGTALAGVDMTAAGPALQALAADPTNLDKIAAAKTALSAAGYTGDLTSGSSVLNLLTQTDAGAAAAAQVSGQLLLTPNVMQSIGLTQDDLTALGITPAQAAKTSVAQLQQMMQNYQAGNSNIENKAAIAQSGTVSGSTARALGADVSTAQNTSAMTSENSVQDVLARAQQGETINIGGTNYNLSSILSDQGFTQLADQYLAAKPGDPIRTQVDQMMPSFGQFVQQNASALQSAQQAAGVAGTQQAAIDTSNQKIVNSITSATGGTTAQVDALFTNSGLPAPSQFSSSNLDLSKNGLLQVLSNPTAFGTNLSTTTAFTRATQLQQQDPAAFKTLASMTPAELQATGVFSVDDAAAKSAWDSFQAVAAEQAALPTQTPTQIAQAMFGTSSLGAAWTNAQAQSELAGNSTELNQLKPLFTDSSGKLLPDATIAANLQKQAGSQSLSAALTTLASGGAVQTEAQKLSSGNASLSTLQSALSSAFDSNGQIDASKIATAIPNDPAKVSPSTLAAYIQSTQGSFANNNGAETALTTKLNQLTDTYVRGQLTPILNNLGPGNPDTPAITQYVSDQLGGVAKGPPQFTNDDQVTMAGQAISSLQKLMADPNSAAESKQLQSVVSGLQSAIADRVTTTVPIPNASPSLMQKYKTQLETMAVAPPQEMSQLALTALANSGTLSPSDSSALSKVLSGTNSEEGKVTSGVATGFHDVTSGASSIAHKVGI